MSGQELATNVKRFLARHPDVAVLLFILAVGAGVRVAFFIWLPPLADGDSFQYHRPAHRLMDGVDFPLDLKRPPAYPVVLALIGKVLGPALWHVVAVQAAMGIGTVVLAYGIGCLTFGRWSGIVAAAAAAISGELLIWEHYVMTETLFTFLLTLCVFLFLFGLRTGSWLGHAGCGLAIGLAALTRPHAQILLLLGPLVVLIHSREVRPAVRAALVTWVAAGLLLMPWMVRNQLDFGTFTVAGSLGHTLVYKTALLHSGAFVFYEATGGSADQDAKLRRTNQLIQRIIDERVRGGGREWAAITIHSTLTRTMEIGEAEADALMRRAAVEAILKRPLTYVWLIVHDLWPVAVGVPEDLRAHWRQSKPRDERTRLATLMPSPSAEQRDRIPDLELLANVYQSARVGPLLVILFFAGLAAAWLVPAWRPALFPASAVLVLHLATAATAGVNPRYHHPTIPLVHAIAFGGVLALWYAVRALRCRFGHPDRSPYSAKPSLET